MWALAPRNSCILGVGVLMELLLLGLIQNHVFLFMRHGMHIYYHVCYMHIKYLMNIHTGY